MAAGEFRLWTDAEMAYMRAVQSDNLPDECSVLRLAYTADGHGGTLESWTEVASSACRFQLISRATGNTGAGEARLWADHELHVQDGLLTLPWNSSGVLVNDKITILNVEQGIEVTYRVISVNNPQTIMTARRIKLTVTKEG